MDAARAKRIFAIERETFARYFPTVKHTKFVLLDQPCTHLGHCRFRDLAFADPGPSPTVSMLMRTLKLPDANVVALIRHELGHVADRDIERPWREQRADDIAEFVTGHKIYYDTCNIQTVRRARYPRPLNLHR